MRRGGSLILSGNLCPLFSFWARLSISIANAKSDNPIPIALYKVTSAPSGRTRAARRSRSTSPRAASARGTRCRSTTSSSSAPAPGRPSSALNRAARRSPGASRPATPSSSTAARRWSRSRPDSPSPQVSGVPQSLVLVVCLSLSLVAPTPAAPGLVNTHCGCNGGFSAHRLLASAHPPTGRRCIS